jgi:DNA polymerase-1
MLQADYSQIELRVAACLFNDTAMQNVYLENGDIHTQTAKFISGKTEEEWAKLTDAERKHFRVTAKRVNFGSIYGIGGLGIQRTLRKDGVFISAEEGEEFLKTFFEKRPQLRAGMDKYAAICQRLGYVELFTGRRRRIPEIFADNVSLRNRAIRQAINAPVQGTASEMTMMSMVLIWREMRRLKLRSKLVMTVHDSIVFDCVREEVLTVAKLAKTIMENIMHLSNDVWTGLSWSWLKVPIVAELEAGLNWGAGIKFDPHTIESAERSEKPLHWRDDKGSLLHRDPTDEDELHELMKLKAQEN